MSNDKPVLNATDMLNYSATLVEKLGKYTFPDGETLVKKLTFEGISFWDVFSVEFAHSYIPTILASSASSENIIQLIRPGLIRLKYMVRDFVCRWHNARGCSTWPAGKTILFLGFTHQMYRDVLHPVVERLAMRKDCQVVVLSDQSRADVKLFTADNCEYQTIWQHLNKETKRQVFKLQKLIRQLDVGLQLTNVLLDALPDVDQRLLCNFRNLFSRFFKAYFPGFILQAIAARHILENHRPALVIASDTADSRTRIYAVLCRFMGISYMDVQFGLTGDEGVEWRFLIADCVAVWGDSAKEAMLKQKVPEEKIIITGSPRYDCLVNLPKFDVKLKRTMFGVPEKSALVVLASAYYLKTHDKYSDPKILRAMQYAIFDAADKTPGIFLIVKPHPVENVSQTRALFKKSPNIIFVERQSDIRELIKVCDAFISFGSTATIDALIADKLTVCPIFPGWAFSDIFKNSGATLVPKSSEEIMDIFKKVANGLHCDIKVGLEPARQNFLKHHVYREDGMSAARVETLALKMSGIEEH